MSKKTIGIIIGALLLIAGIAWALADAGVF